MFSGTVSTDGNYQDTTITNDGFWPDLNAGDFEKRRGIPADLASETIAYALAAAVSQINIELAGVKSTHIESGTETAAEVEGQPKIGEKNLLIILYEKAVFARAKADLVPEFASVQMREAGDRVAESEADITNRLLAESQQHIRAIKGKGRTGIDLL
jgi:hypothetical protein